MRLSEKRFRTVVAVLALSGLLASCTRQESDPRAGDVRKRIERLAHVPMEFDGRHLPENRKVLVKSLVEACKLVHEVYLRQTDPEGVWLRDSLARRGDELSKQILRLVIRNGGAYDKMDGLKNFVNRKPRQVEGGFYPPGFSKVELEDYVALFPAQGASLASAYTIIRREGSELRAVPYQLAFEEWLVPAAELLNKASANADQGELAAYLTSRAEALLSSDYAGSHAQWLALRDSDIDLRLAPDRLTDDRLFGMKASFSAAVMLVDGTETAKLAVYNRYREELEKMLPLDAGHRFQQQRLLPELVVVHDIFRGGGVAIGYQHVVSAFDDNPTSSPLIGTKKFLAKNIIEARTEHVILPMVREAFGSDYVQYVTKEGVFLNVALREFAHAIGSQVVASSTDSVTIEQSLAEHFLPMELIKATVVGLHAGKYFMAAGILPSSEEQAMFVSSVALLCNAARGNAGEHEQQAATVLLNYFFNKGAIRLDPNSGKLAVFADRMSEAVADAEREALQIYAEGDYRGAEQWLGKWSQMERELKDRLENLEHVPDDIEPVYVFRW